MKKVGILMCLLCFGAAAAWSDSFENQVAQGIGQAGKTKEALAAMNVGAGKQAAAAESTAQTTVETVITCNQDDGDQWVQIGIALNDGPGLRALVVVNDVDDDSSKLVMDRQVFSTKKDGKTIYEDSHKTIRLVVFRDSSRFHELQGDLSVIQDGPGSLRQEGLFCYERSNISFDK